MHYGSPAQRILIFLFTLRAAPHTHWHKINNTKPKFLLFPSTCWPLFRFGLNVSAACHAMKELSGPMLCVATQKLKFAGAHIFHHHHFDSPPSWSSTGASREASSISCCCHATFSAILQSSAPRLLRSSAPPLLGPSKEGQPPYRSSSSSSRSLGGKRNKAWNNTRPNDHDRCECWQ